jgi:hypothetical protein
VNFAREQFGNYNRKLAQLAEHVSWALRAELHTPCRPRLWKTSPKEPRDVSRGIIQRAGNNDVDIAERIRGAKRSGGGRMEERSGEI